MAAETRNLETQKSPRRRRFFVFLRDCIASSNWQIEGEIELARQTLEIANSPESVGALHARLGFLCEKNPAAAQRAFKRWAAGTPAETMALDYAAEARELREIMGWPATGAAVGQPGADEAKIAALNYVETLAAKSALENAVRIWASGVQI